MSLEDDQQLESTRFKLAALDKQIAIASARPQSDANAASVRSLVQMANQLREEIARYAASKKRQAS